MVKVVIYSAPSHCDEETLAGANKRLLHGYHGIGAMEDNFQIVFAKPINTGAEVRS